MFELQYRATHNTVTKTILSDGNHFGPLKLYFNPPLFVEVPATSQESERSRIHVLEVSIFTSSMICLFYFETDPTVSYLFWILFAEFSLFQHKILNMMVGFKPD